MKKGEVYSIDDRDLDEANGKHVIIEWDGNPVNPLHDWDQVFYFHSNIGRYLSGNEDDKNYPGLPLVEIEDEDGFPTGKHEFMKDVIAFQVSAYIHSRVALSLGDGSHFPDRQWDVTSRAGWMWTDKERWEKMCRKWMHVYDEKTKKDRPAKDMKEFKEYCRTIAEGELETLQKCIDGEVFGYRTEVAIPYKKTYSNGEEIEGVDWDDDGDSCWGYVVDSVGDIDFPKGEGWKVFDATGHFVGDKYDIPEFVVTKVEEGKRYYISQLMESGASGGRTFSWDVDKNNAIVFRSFWECQNVAREALGDKAVTVREMYDPNSNCVEIDSIKEGNME